MRVLLIVYDNESYVHWFPQGTAAIAAVLRQAGHEVEIYNQDVHHWPEIDLTNWLDLVSYDVVAVGVIGGYYQYKKLLKISKAINASKYRNEFEFIIAGHGPTPEPEYFLKKTGADVCVMGEGEATILEHLDEGKSANEAMQVDGIATSTGGINKRRAPIVDLDTLPFPAYDLFPMEYYRLMRAPRADATDFCIPMLTGRGCPFKCNFCYRMDPGHRQRSIDSIISEIDLLHTEYGINYIIFADELLMSSTKRTVEICKAILDSGMRIKWSCQGRLNYAKKSTLNLMKKAGCQFINYGIEAIDDEVLRRMNKALSVKQITNGIESTLAAGISPGFNIIFGNYGDTEKTLQKGVEFLTMYDDYSQMRTIRPVTPYPGSQLYYDAIASGKLRGVEDFYECKHVNSDLLTVNFTTMTDDEFYNALRDANIELLYNYHQKCFNKLVTKAINLYDKKDTSFRGWRQM